jgi:hypothetical protein
MSFNTNNTPSVTEALETRITCRDFLDKPVSGEILKRILQHFITKCIWRKPSAMENTYHSRRDIREV